MNDRDLKKIIDLLPKFQTDQEWLAQYRRDSNITISALAFITATIFVGILVLAVVSRS